MPPPVPPEARRAKAPPPPVPIAAPTPAPIAAPTPAAIAAPTPPPPPAPIAEPTPPRADPSPVLSEPPPQTYQSWPTDDDPVDMAAIGIRRSLLPRISLPPGIAQKVADRVRSSITPERRKHLKRTLASACIAALRAFRAVLDKTAELTVKLELRLRE